MSEQGEKSGTPPRKDFINVDDTQELEAWVHCMQVSRADLERAVEMVGPAVGAVYDHLRRPRLPPGPASS